VSAHTASTPTTPTGHDHRPETLAKPDLSSATPQQIRQAYREQRYSGDTWGLAPEYLQVATVVVPAEVALDFFTFCQRNSPSCPVLEVLDRGSSRVKTLAPDADITTDLGKYRVFRNGDCIDEPPHIDGLWSDDLVTFLIGCTASFEPHLVSAGIDLPYVAEGKTTPVYVTDRQANEAGVFRGPLAVSMRQVAPEMISRVVQITSRYPAFHGAPVHVGDPGVLGIADLEQPYSGDPPRLDVNKVPVFWACSVTPQLAAMASATPFMMSNAPNFMFLADTLTTDLAVFA
jgi:uncharacterized protein YcsI (UPF0317 family)